jgi:hypothetical protein
MPPDAAAAGGPPAGKATTSGAAAAPAASGQQQQQQALSGPVAGAAGGGSNAPKKPPAGAAFGLRPGVAERTVSTAKFMRQMGRKDGFKKEAPGFAARWINGTGVLVWVWVCVGALAASVSVWWRFKRPDARSHRSGHTDIALTLPPPPAPTTTPHTPDTHARAGMPLLTAALSWDTRHSQLLLALRQSGSKAVLRGSLRGVSGWSSVVCSCGA